MQAPAGDAPQEAQEWKGNLTCTFQDDSKELATYARAVPFCCHETQAAWQAAGWFFNLFAFVAAQLRMMDRHCTCVNSIQAKSDQAEAGLGNVHMRSRCVTSFLCLMKESKQLRRVCMHSGLQQHECI